MKIRINYNLIEKIKEANNGVKLQKHLKSYGQIAIFSFSLATITHLILYNKPHLLENLLIFSTMYYNVVITHTCIDMILKEEIKDAADLDLYNLSFKLHGLGIKTSKELIKEAKLIKSRYKIKYTDKDKLRLVNEKYIDVPLNNGYNETVLQEHIIGSRNYDISVKSPNKKQSLKLVKQN